MNHMENREVVQIIKVFGYMEVFLLITYIAFLKDGGHETNSALASHCFGHSSFMGRRRVNSSPSRVKKK